MRTVLALTLLTLTSLGAANAAAQSTEDIRTVIAAGVSPGDRLTIVTDDGATMKGRLVATGTNELLVRAREGTRTFSYGDIREVTRRKNGIILGAIIGTGAGLLVGVPLGRWADNEGEDGDRILATFLAAGIGAGLGLDALINSDRIVYRKPLPRRAGFDVRPRSRGGVITWSASW